MPEYHNLQAYARYDPATFRAHLARYRDVLRAVGCFNRSVEDWIARIEPDDPGDGFGFPVADDGWVELDSAGMLLKAGPHLMGFSRDAFPQTRDLWVEFGLLFETERLQRGSSFSAWEYREGLGHAIWNLMRAFGPAFPELGVFLTDEAQDGLPLEGYLEGSERLWRFDLAWVPEHNAPLFTPVPGAFFSGHEKGALALAAKRAWKGPPWE